MTQIRLNQIKNLIDIDKGYHPILNVLFQKCKHPVLSVVRNFFVGICCCILLLSVAYGFFELFKSYANATALCVHCSMYVFFSVFILTIKRLYSSLHGEREQCLLKALPVKNSEILIAIFIKNLKRNLYISSFFYCIACFAFLYKYSSLNICFVCFVLAFVVPSLAILFSMFLCFLRNKFFKERRKEDGNGILNYNSKTVLNSLITFERKNIYHFSTLKMELITQNILFILVSLLSVYVHRFFIVAYVLHPALSAVNYSSFSREGKFHFILKSLPLNDNDRFYAKIIAYVRQVLPVILLCLFFVALKLESWDIICFIPSFVFCIVNMAIVGVLCSKRNSNFCWVEQREATRVNVGVILKCFTIAFLTCSMVFIPESLFVIKIVAILIVTVFNVVLTILGVRKISLMSKPHESLDCC